MSLWSHFRTPELLPVEFEPNTGCWLWAGQVKFPGYGVLTADGKTTFAHRASWMTFRGPIPPDMFVCHKCDTPPCINPDHLFLGTPAANSRDMVAKGRHGSARNPVATARAQEIIAALGRGMYPDEIAALHGVTESLVFLIRSGGAWAHLPRPSFPKNTPRPNLRPLPKRPACKWGHPFDEINTSLTARGRVCRQCRATRDREYRGRRPSPNVNNRDKTHCKRGHEFIVENIIRTPKGHRRCKACTLLLGQRQSLQDARVRISEWRP